MNEPLLAVHHETGVKIRKATLADRDALIELMRLVFAETAAEKSGELGPEFWDWQFGRQPAGRTDIWVGELNGQIVAQVPINVVRLKWENRELLAGWAIDLLVHPNHRDKSLFIKVGRVANKEMGETGIGVSLGLPNKRSFPGATRFLKYELVCQVPVLVLPVRWSALLRRAGIPSWASRMLGPLAAMGHRLIRLPVAKAKGVVFREVSKFPETIDNFWQRASAKHMIISVRDGKYLAWRYCDCPTRSYRILVAERDGELAGYLVHRVFVKDGLKMGAIVDVLVDPGSQRVLNELLRRGIAELRAQGVDAVMTLMQGDDFYYSALRRCGFVRIPERFNPRTFNLVCRVLEPGIPKSDFNLPENWFITLGDFDVY